MKTDCDHCGRKQVDAYTYADSLVKICTECRHDNHYGYAVPCPKCVRDAGKSFPASEAGE